MQSGQSGMQESLLLLADCLDTCTKLKNSRVQNLLLQTKVSHLAYCHVSQLEELGGGGGWVEPLDGKLGAANSTEADRN